MSRRGVLYIVWEGAGGSGCGRVGYHDLLERSRESLREWLPGLPVAVRHGVPGLGLANKAKMLTRSPFESTLFLDADTVVLGDLGHAWAKAERYGIAVAIGQCPWLRRYGHQFGDQVEYNTGVLFFDRDVPRVPEVFRRWEELVRFTPPSRFHQGDRVCGLEADDQWAFGRALEDVGFNPYALPVNYNFMAGWTVRFFTPIKIWHSVHPVPPGLAGKSARAAAGGDLVSFCAIGEPKTEVP